MKLRQKLAAVIAATMVVTAVPVITSATTSNTISMSSVSIVNDGEIGFSLSTDTTSFVTTSSVYNATAKPLTLDIESKANYSLGAGQSFFVEIENAEFSDAAFYSLITGANVNVDKNGYILDANGYILDANGNKQKVSDLAKAPYTATTAGGAEYSVQKISDTELKVTVTGDPTNHQITANDIIAVPIVAVAKSGQVTVKVDGTDSFVTSETKVIGETSNKNLSATVTDATTITTDGGKIGNIVIAENKIGALNSLTGTDRQIKIELGSSSDVEFSGSSNIKLVGKKGLSGMSTIALTSSDVVIDEQILTITLPAGIPAGTARGQLSIEGIEVVPVGRTASIGDVAVTVKNKAMDNTKLTVAKVGDQAVDLTVKEAKEIIAGKGSKQVTFTLKENTKDSIIDGRKVEFTIENGFIAVRDYDANAKNYKSALDTFKALVTAGDIELPEEILVSDITAVEANNEGQITGFTVQFNNLKANKESELEFTMPIMADINTTGEVKLAVEGRAIEKAVSAVIANAKAAFAVTAEAVELKTGLNGQVGGKLTIAETSEEMFDKGTVEIAMADTTGISFKKDQDLNIKAENLKIKDVKVYADAITFTVDRTSDEAGSIVIEGIEFNVDRTAPQGTFDLEMTGTAISENVYMKAGLEGLTVADFVVIGTTNTEDITGSNGLAKGTAVFSINSNTYTLNGEAKTMDAAAYLANNRTMMPIRYVSEAFGISGNNIMFSNGVVTLIAGNRIVQLKNGSNIATLNGVSIAMDEKVTIKEGRTYIPVGEVARILGVNVNWNNQTKTATFSN